MNPLRIFAPLRSSAVALAAPALAVAAMAMTPAAARAEDPPVVAAPVCPAGGYMLPMFGTQAVGRIVCTDPAGLPLTYSAYSQGATPDNGLEHSNIGDLTIGADGTLMFHSSGTFQEGRDEGYFQLVASNGTSASLNTAVRVTPFTYAGPPVQEITSKKLTVSRKVALKYGIVGTLPVPSKYVYRVYTQLFIDAKRANQLGIAKGATKPVAISLNGGTGFKSSDKTDNRTQGELGFKLRFSPPLVASKIAAAHGPIVLEQRTEIINGTMVQHRNRTVVLTG